MLTLQQSSLAVPLGVIWIDAYFHFFHSWVGEWIYQGLTLSPFTIALCDTYFCIMFYGFAFFSLCFLDSFHSSVRMISIFLQSFLTSLNSSRYRFFLTSSDDHLLLYYTRQYWKDVLLDSVSVHCLLWFWMSPAILHFSPGHIQALKLSRGFVTLPFLHVHICLFTLSPLFFSALHVYSFYHNGLHVLPVSIIVMIPQWPSHRIWSDWTGHQFPINGAN